MGILLLVVGALALGSGMVKLRTHTRAELGVSWLTVAEVVAGSVLVAGAGAGLARVRPLAWLAVVTGGFVVVAAAIAHVRRMADRAAERDQSAERRFRRYLGAPGRER